MDISCPILLPPSRDRTGRPGRESLAQTDANWRRRTRPGLPLALVLIAGTLGVGGLAGSYIGARIQSRLPGVLIRRLVGVLVLAIGTRYLWAGLG